MDEIQARFNEASTPAEEAAVKADATAAKAAESALLTQINSKYSAERERLDNLLATVRSNTSASGNVQSASDSSSSTPSLEFTTVQLPDIEF
jgi:hypothetical protein